MKESVIFLICSNCGKQFSKFLGEYNRRIKKGQKRFYCCLKCSGKGVNSDKKAKDLILFCPVCGNKFFSSTKVRASKFCSRSCASKGSVTEKRREAGINACIKSRELIPSGVVVQRLLKKRENWKYSEVEAYLKEIGENYEFEYLLNDFIYDLILFEHNLVIEFDGPDHKSIDETKKENNLLKYDLQLIRISVESNKVIPLDLFIKAMNF